MKLTPLFCALLLTLVPGGFGTLMAQDTTQPPAGGPPGGPHKMDFLTPEEKGKLEKAKTQALSTNAALKAQSDEFKKEREARKENKTKPTPDERKAMMEKRMAFEQQLHAAMIQADPSVAPIITKVEEHRKAMMGKLKERRADKPGGGAGQTAPGTPTTK